MQLSPHDAHVFETCTNSPVRSAKFSHLFFLHNNFVNVVIVFVLPSTHFLMSPFFLDFIISVCKSHKMYIKIEFLQIMTPNVGHDHISILHPSL